MSVLRNVRVGPSPRRIARRLLLAGMRPINNVVDASNYVMGVYVFIVGYAHSDFGRGAGISILMLLMVAALSVAYVRKMVQMGDVT